MPQCFALRVGPGRPRTTADSTATDKGYSNGPCREHLRRLGIPRHSIPEKSDSQATRPPAQRLAQAGGHQASTKSGTRGETPPNKRSAG
ncbi:hypothetical protein GCM10010378_07360 [Streptomyces viridochromogenes]